MDSIEIKGYKSIKEAQVELRPINILIGANGSGKSNFLSFFEFLDSLHHGNLKEYVGMRGGDDKFLFQGKETTDVISFHITFNENTNGYVVELKVGNDGFIFRKEDLRYQGRPKDISVYGSEARIRETDNFRAKYVLRHLEGVKKYQFHDTGRTSPFNNPSHIENDIHYLYPDGRNLAAFLYHIEQNNELAYKRIVYNIQSVAPYFLDFYLKPNPGKFVRLHWNDRYCPMLYGTTDLSDGTLRFIALSALFLQPELPRTIVIDEPELGLHPFALGKLAGMIRSASKRGCQVIVATQSVDLISHFEPEDIITVDLDDGQSHFKRLNSEELRIWLDDDYTLGDLWKRNVIDSGQPNYSL